MIQKIIIKIVTAKITNSRYCLTASPKNIRTRLTRKNLEPLPKRLTQKNFKKCIFKIPLLFTAVKEDGDCSSAAPADRPGAPDTDRTEHLCKDDG